MPRQLKYCDTCKEKSRILEVKVRKRDGAKVVYEYCINANPDCRYKTVRVLETATNEDRQKTSRPVQLELFGN